MIHKTESSRRFRVSARHADHHHARFVEETSFEAAAVAYLEQFDLSAPIDDKGAFRVIVHDVQTGREHCFKLDLDTGATIPCG
jgi:hypothetical protein